MEVEQNNLVHIGEMDTETGRLLLAYRETPDVELLRKLSQGFSLKASGTRLQNGNILKCKAIGRDEKEAKTLTRKNLELEPTMPNYVIKMAYKMEKLLGRKVFKRSENNRDEISAQGFCFY